MLYDLSPHPLTGPYGAVLHCALSVKGGDTPCFGREGGISVSVQHDGSKPIGIPTVKPFNNKHQNSLPKILATAIATGFRFEGVHPFFFLDFFAFLAFRPFLAACAGHQKGARWQKGEQSGRGRRGKGRAW